MEYLIIYDIFFTIRKREDISRVLEKIEKSPIEEEKKSALYDIIGSISSNFRPIISSKL